MNTQLQRMICALTILIAGLLLPGATAFAQESFTGVVEICQVTANVLNVRSGPGTVNTVVGALKKDQKVVVLASQSDWARHGNGGWSSRTLMKCATYTRAQITQDSLPSGYWLHATATYHTGGRAVEYDAISTPAGETWQPWIPMETFRKGHDVSITLPRGAFTFHGVACFITIDLEKKGDQAKREEVATHQNNGSFTLSKEAWARVVCDDSDVTGFSIALGGGSNTQQNAGNNSPYGPRESFKPNEAAGQFLMLSYDCDTDERLPQYDGVKEPNGDVWQPWLPLESERAKQCFNTALVALEASFSFNGIACQMWLDENLEGKGDQGRLVAEWDNGILFNVDTFQNKKFDDKESWALVRCKADPHNGFSIRRR